MKRRLHLHSIQLSSRERKEKENGVSESQVKNADNNKFRNEDEEMERASQRILRVSSPQKTNMEKKEKQRDSGGGGALE